MSLQTELLQLTDYQAINNIIPGIVMHPLQCVDTLKAIYGKRSIISYDTGLGKTIVASAILQLLLQEDPTRKFIYLMKASQISQTPADIEDYTRKNTLLATGDKKYLNTYFFPAVKESSYTVLCCTTESLISSYFTDWLVKEIPNIYGIFIDEAHHLSNRQHAQSSMVVDGLCSQIKNVWALTATPITTSPMQLARLLRTVGGKQFSDYVSTERELRYGRFSIEDYPFLIINRNAEEFGRVTPAKGYAIVVEPTDEQIYSNAGGNEMFQINRGRGATPQLKSLCDFIENKTKQGQRGLVFINQHVVREAVVEYKDANGYTFSYDCIHGEIPKHLRRGIQDRFNIDKDFSACIISIKECINLDCDYVVFYELTCDVKQVMGRAHRGHNDKELEVYFMFTDLPKEYEYFYNNVYLMSAFVQDLFKKNYSEIISVQRNIEQVR